MGLFKKIFKSKDTEPGTEPANKYNGPTFLPGDIFYTRSANKFRVYKLLVIDEDFEVWHVLSYSPLDDEPTIEDIDRFSVSIYHAPFDPKAFTDAVMLDTWSVKANDLTGYHHYLRQTQPPEYWIPIANIYYKEGYRLTDESLHYDAIDAYSKAIDLFPQFYEAIDNRAFCKMDLALWPEAIEDFKLSLQQKPNSVLAEFSIGECYFNVGDYQKAKTQFEIAHNIDPSAEAPIIFLKKVNEISGK